MPDTQAAPIDTVSTQKAASDRPRLHFLDGIRGITSLYVMWTHLALFLPPDLLFTQPWLDQATSWMREGRTAVAVFIVLSGYCLMLPVAFKGLEGVPGGFQEYILRRARRIFPPYYAALVLSIVLLFVFRSRLLEVQTFWSSMLPVNVGTVISHVLMMHNVNEQWITRIDAPMWSVATEWQIYFLFALLFLPLFKKSVSAALVAALAIGLAPMFFLHRGEGASPWFGVLFCFGMIGASVCHAGSERWRRFRSGSVYALWGASALAAVVLSAGWHLFRARHQTLLWKGELVEDVLVGMAVMCAIVWCTLSVQNGAPNLLVRLLQSRPLLFLGTISYSLYLFHVPLLGAWDMGIRALGLSGVPAALLYLFGGTAISIGLTYPLYRAFEKPFLTR